MEHVPDFIEQQENKKDKLQIYMHKCVFLIAINNHTYFNLQTREKDDRSQRVQ